MSESNVNPGVPMPHADLVAVLDEFTALDRYSRQREEVLKQLADTIYACEIEFDSSERTYGYTPDDRFRDGRTVIGSLAGSTHAVSIKMPANENDAVESLGSGDVVVQAGRFVKWSSIYDRFELIATPSVTLGDPAEQEPTVEEGVEEAAKIQRKNLNPFIQYSELESKLNIPLASLRLSVRASNCLETENIHAVRDLVQLTEDELLEVRNFGETMLTEVREKLTELGLHLGMRVPPPEEVPPDAVEETVKVVEPPVASQRSVERPSSVSIPPVSSEDRNALLDATGPVTSHQLIQFLTGALQFQQSQVTAIVDGLWDYILQPGNYRGRNRNWVLPHFGTFSLAYEAGQASLQFRSRPRKELRGQQANHWNRVASDRWIRYYQGQSDAADVKDLSVKRRISIWVAEQTDLPLRTVHRVIWELMNIVRDIMAEGSRAIRWAMRGEMYCHDKADNEPGPSADYYAFRTYGRLRHRLPQLAVPASTSPATVVSARLASASSATLAALTGWLKPKRRFTGPGVLRGAGGVGGSTTADPSIWFSWKLWLVPWLFVIFLNFLSWNVPYENYSSLRLQILAATVGLPLALSIIFHVMGSVLLALTGQSTDHLPRWTLRFFVVISVLSGGVGFVVVLAQWLILHWSAGGFF